MMDPKELAKKYILQAENIKSESSNQKSDISSKNSAGRPKKNEKKKRKQRVVCLCTAETAGKFRAFCEEREVSASSILDAYIKKVLKTGRF